MSAKKNNDLSVFLEAANKVNWTKWFIEDMWQHLPKWNANENVPPVSVHLYCLWQHQERKKRQSNYNNLQVIIIRLRALILPITSNKATKWQWFHKTVSLRFHLELTRYECCHLWIPAMLLINVGAEKGPLFSDATVSCRKASGSYCVTTLHYNDCSHLMGVTSALLCR